MLLWRNDEFGIRAKNKIIFVQFSSFVSSFQIKFVKRFSGFALGFFPILFSLLFL